MLNHPRLAKEVLPVLLLQPAPVPRVTTVLQALTVQRHAQSVLSHQIQLKRRQILARIVKQGRFALIVE
jgi:hypothetical protein